MKKFLSRKLIVTVAAVILGALIFAGILSPTEIVEGEEMAKQDWSKILDLADKVVGVLLALGASAGYLKAQGKVDAENPSEH
jgi:hypothetical protein